jgi:hypothetical protein
VAISDQWTSGAISAEVVREAAEADQPAKKHIAAPRYEPIELEFGFDMAPAVYDWMAATWAGSSQRLDGGVLEVGASTGNLTAQRFFDATIVSTAIPACDASSKEQAYVKSPSRRS